MNKTEGYKAMSKMELAQAAGVSISTLRSWIIKHEEHLAELGVSHFAKILNPAAVRYLCDLYGIDINEYYEKWRKR